MNIDCYVVTTWPGHCFQTALCLRSIVKHLPTRPIHIVVDTNYHNDSPIQTPWPTFESDIKQYIQNQGIPAQFKWHRVSDVPCIDQCSAVPWRQQLVRLCLDQYIPEESWVWIGADIIFADALNFDYIPVVYGTNQIATVSLGVKQYVKHLLHSDHDHIVFRNVPVCAESIPLRLMNRTLLTNLRSHVENLHGKDFVQLHLDWFASHQIVASDPHGMAMNMCDLTLLEVYRQYLSDQAVAVRPIGRAHTFSLQSFERIQIRHSGLTDWAVGRTWLEAQHLKISHKLWQSSAEFKDNLPHVAY